MKKISLIFLAFVFGSFLLLNAHQAHAYLYGFHRITNNAPDNVAGQLSVDVLDAGSNQVAFKFYNTAVISSSITQIYFDDGTLSSFVSIADSDGAALGVDFEQGATPPDLPGGNSISPHFDVTDNFKYSATNPPVAHGVNASSEWVEILFTLDTGKDFDDLIAAIVSGDLRIGLHVQGIPVASGTTSDSFVNLVPTPAAAWLLGSGLLGLVAIRRRKKQS